MGIGQSKFNLTHGSILGITHDFFNVLAFRHQPRHPSLSNAYFVGASAHPGTGVPIAIAGSRLATREILKDQGLAIPSTWKGSNRRVVSDLDVLRSKTMIHHLEDLVGSAYPRAVGAVLALLAAILVLWLNGHLTPKTVAPAPRPVVEIKDLPRHELPSLDLESLGQPALWGSVVALFLGIAYLNLPGGRAT